MQNSQVTFLNHSCINVSSGATTILCDPWFTGSAFDNGWRLLAEETHDLGALPHDWIWISHEHPDHFSIATLKQLKGPTKFIYQATQDGKVSGYLRGKGHEVSEVGDFEARTHGDIACQLFASDGYDSAVLFTLPDGRKVLNVNDCRIELGGLLERIAAAVGSVDLLTIQFSYANWAGNAGDEAIPRLQHEQVLERVEQAIRVLKPKATLLFASYVYFSHDENFHWNEHFWVDQVIAKLSPLTRLIVPKPNDVIDLAALDATDFSARNEAARSYWTDLHDTRAPADHAREHLTIEQLREEFARFHEAIWRDNDLAFARATSRGPVQLDVKLTDLNESVRLDLYEGQMERAPDGAYDIAVSSEVLKFLFRSKFGRGSLTINGRVHFNYETAHRFFVFFFAYYANNIGKRLAPDGGLTWANVRSIAKTAVLESIFRTTPQAQRNYDAFIEDFLPA